MYIVRKLVGVVAGLSTFMLNLRYFFISSSQAFSKKQLVISDESSVSRNEIRIELPYQEKALNTRFRRYRVQFKWLILCAAFANNFLVTGMASSFGVLYVEFLEAFGDSKAKTATVGSMLLGVMFGTGPLVGYFSKRTSLRKLCLIGGVLSSVGLMSSAFASNLLCLYFTYGFLAGCGFCCINLPSVVIVNQYFRQRRVLASTLAVSGCGVGSLVYPFLLTSLIQSEGWRITLIYLSAVQLQTCVLGMFFRPATDNQPVSVSKEIAVEIVLDSSETTETGFNKIDNSIKGNTISICKDNGNAVDESPNIHISVSTRDTSVPTEHVPSSRVNVSMAESSDQYYSPVAVESATLQTQSRNAQDCVRSSILHIQPCNTYDRVESPILQSQSCNTHDRVHSPAIIEKDLPLNKPPSTITTMTILTQCRSGVCGNTRYLLFLITCLPYTAGVVVPAAVITDCILRRGGDKDLGALMVSVIGVAGTAGRVIAGLITMHKKVDPLLFYAINRIISGVSCILITYTLIDTISFLPIVVFGFSYGAVAGLDPPILTDLVGLSQLSMAYGYFAFAMGIGCIISTPLAGFLVDEFHSYRIAFVVAGSMCILGGLAMIPILIRVAPARIVTWIKKKLRMKAVM